MAEAGSVQFTQCQVQFEHIDALFAEEAQYTAFAVCRDESLDFGDRQAPSSRHTGRLESWPQPD